ncbi:MAG: MFS transporter [Rothia sp. (in: high G+C Gram-positive bacteria)]|nr:MFS transporter [Rothia sp. (in: high G+C Gram-positive bacteria)]
MLNNNQHKILITIALAFSLFAEGSIYYLIIFGASKEENKWLLTGISFATVLPSIFLAAPLGWAIDRFPIKRLWVGSLVVSALLSFGMMLTENYYILILLLAIQTICSILVGSVLFKGLPRIEGFTKDSASSYIVGLSSVLAIVTPPASGLLFSTGRNLAFLTITALFVVSLIMVAMLVPPLNVRATAENLGLREIFFGLKSLKSISAIKYYLPVMFAVVLFTTMEDLSGIIYLQEISANYLRALDLQNIDSGALGYSFIISMWPIGSLIASIMIGKNYINLRGLTSLVLGGFLVCLAVFFEGLIENVLLIALFFIVGGAGNAIHNIGVRNIVYDTIPEGSQGRAWTFIGASFTIFSALGKFLGTPYLLAEPKEVIFLSGLAGMTLIFISSILIFFNKKTNT